MGEDKSKLELIGEIAQANNKNLELIEEINQLQNNWNELKKHLQSLLDTNNYVLSDDYVDCARDVLYKMQELEQGKNERTN